MLVPAAKRQVEPPRTPRETDKKEKNTRMSETKEQAIIVELEPCRGRFEVLDVLLVSFVGVVVCSFPVTTRRPVPGKQCRCMRA
jgi:hypothetical protein